MQVLDCWKAVVSCESTRSSSEQVRQGNNTPVVECNMFIALTSVFQAMEQGQLGTWTQACFAKETAQFFY